MKPQRNRKEAAKWLSCFVFCFKGLKKMAERPKLKNKDKNRFQDIMNDNSSFNALKVIVF